MPPTRCNVFHHSGTLAWACTKLCMLCMTVGIYMVVSILPCHTDEHLCILCYPLHSALLAQILPSWSKSLFCFPRMVNTRSNPAAPEQGEASAARNENLPQPPSLAEVMLEAERNKRE